MNQRYFRSLAFILLLFGALVFMGQSCGEVCTDADGDGYSFEGGNCGLMDCDDTDPDVNPGEDEFCDDGIDNDCDENIDEGCPVDGDDDDNDTGGDDVPTDTIATGEFPDFITENEDYYITRIGSVPDIDEETYELKITGLVENPGSFTLEELRSLELIELPLTVECIGNQKNGSLVSTAVWTGFNLYDFLVSLEPDESATGVQYLAADGYYASHTLEQIKDNQVIGALFMNKEVIPPVQGFPLRILNPGFYGVKQPAWVTEIEVIGRPLQDYWQDRGWDVSPPMDVDSTIFFPERGSTVNIGVPLEIGGAAFGGTRIASVELTTDGGDSWQETEIVESMDADNVWLFWKATAVFKNPGTYTINSRATDIHGNVQPENDYDSGDGTNSWPSQTVNAVNVLSSGTDVE